MYFKKGITKDVFLSTFNKIVDYITLFKIPTRGSSNRKERSL